MKRLANFLVFSVVILVASTIYAAAQNIMPDFSTIPAGWTTDRYEPASFSNVGVYQGHANVLGIGIDSSTGQSARPAGQQGIFYSTQGRKYTFSPVEGPGSVLSADLYIPSSWGDSSNGHVRTDMWGTMVNGANNISGYPIIGFTNYGSAPRFRIWDGAAWVDLATPVPYDTWVAFAMELLNDSSMNFYINGSLVGNYPYGSTVAFKEVIMQAYNFEQTDIPDAIIAPYTAHWSNSVPVPSDAAECKKNGWKSLFRANGTGFKNQGDCIQYVNTGK